MDWQPLAKELDAIASDAPDKEVPAVQFFSLQRLTAWATCWRHRWMRARHGAWRHGVEPTLDLLQAGLRL